MKGETQRRPALGINRPQRGSIHHAGVGGVENFRQRPLEPCDFREDGLIGEWRRRSDEVGKLMIRKLRSDWVAQQLAASGAGPAAADDPRAVALWRDFHDKFLSYGGPPIPLLRKDMMGATGDLL